MNSCACPRCFRATMGRWTPVDAWMRVITGNDLKSTCRSCGAVEMRAARPGEPWRIQ